MNMCRQVHLGGAVVALAMVMSGMPVEGAIQTFKDEAGRTIYTLDDDGTVTMFETSPGIDTTLSVTRGSKQEMQPQVSEVSPATLQPGTSPMLIIRGKNLVGATVKFAVPGIEVGPYFGKPNSIEVPIRLSPTVPPGDVTLQVTTPIGSTQAPIKVTEMRIGGGGGARREDRPRAALSPEAPSSCPEDMVGVASETGGFCIDVEESFSSDFRSAEKACSTKQKRLCQAVEWRHACEQVTTKGLPLKNIIGNWEWTGSWNVALREDFEDVSTRSILMGKSDCETTFAAPQGKPDVYQGRCCK